MLNEITQRTTNTTCYHFYVESKICQAHQYREQITGCQGPGGGEQNKQRKSKDKNVQL